MTSIIKVNNLQNQCGANIISESANVITIGASGDTVTLAAGASQSGFGRSGSVNWDTTPKTTGFTAVSGNGYFCDTTSAAFTVTLPAGPSAGDIVAIADYANTAATNNITVGRNSSPIDGESSDAKILVNGQVYTLVYVDATEGWKTVGQTFNQISTATFVAATGGCVTTCGDYKIHTFTSPGTFTVTNAGNPGGSSTVDYLVVAGGAGGGSRHGGGGGAGGYRESSGTASGCYSASPLGSGVSALPVSAQGYPIVIGGGGAGGAAPGNNVGVTGSSSSFSTITSTGGGGGGARSDGVSGGSGGGAGEDNPGCGPSPPGGRTGGAGNTPPVSPPQGNAGGDYPASPYAGAAGGGGAGAVGGIGGPGGPKAGGAGATTSISGSPTAYAGGGGGSGGYSNPGSPGGSGGTGGGGAGAPGQGGTGPSGTVNTGGGGGGGSTPVGNPAAGGVGGSGIVIIRYKFQ